MDKLRLEIAANLRSHNLWRRGLIEQPAISSKELGVIIDTAIELLEKPPLGTCTICGAEVGAYVAKPVGVVWGK